jgi:hypothetical protein
MFATNRGALSAFLAWTMKSKRTAQRVSTMRGIDGVLTVARCPMLDVCDEFLVRRLRRQFFHLSENSTLGVLKAHIAYDELGE